MKFDLVVDDFLFLSILFFFCQIQSSKEFLSTSSCIHVLFCTAALGMGIHIPDIRMVIHRGGPADVQL